MFILMWDRQIVPSWLAREMYVNVGHAECPHCGLSDSVIEDFRASIEP